MTWWHYLLLANVYLTLFFVFYALFLRKETFFNLNRIYLVSSALLSFFIPVIQSDWIKTLFITQKVQETIYHVNTTALYQFTVTATRQHQLTLGQILGGIYLVGILVLTIKFIYQLAVLNWVINQPKSEISFSFFNQIRIEEHDSDNDVITAHEQVHARQWHSADILLLEAIMIINWFNPVVYLYRNAVKYIHEFIADRDAIKDGADKTAYAMLLLSQTFTAPPHRLVNPFFNSSLLKQRILMLNKNRSHWVMLVKYGLSAPLFALMLVLSSATVDNSKTIQAISNTADRVFTTPASQAIKTGTITAEDEADLYAVMKQNDATIAMENKLLAANKASATEVFTKVEHSAEYPGGIQAFYKFLGANIRYPEEARKRNLQGKVFCTFIIEKDGSITDLRILRGIGGGTDQEALRVLSAMPNWAPGVQNGNKVRQQYTVPINFSLNDNNSTDEVFSAVEQSATFPGGIVTLYNYLGKTINYPAEARAKNVQGRVFLTFVVEKDGALSNVKVMRGIGSGCDEEAIRVLVNGPKWLPGTQNGRAVRQQYTAPVIFSIADEQIANKQINTDTIRLESTFASHIKTQSSTLLTDAKISAPTLGNRISSAIAKPLNNVRDKAAKNILSEKGTNGIVLMLTKRKPFYDQEGLTN
jgi:TonB family protein